MKNATSTHLKKADYRVIGNRWNDREQGSDMSGLLQNLVFEFITATQEVLM